MQTEKGNKKNNNNIKFNNIKQQTLQDPHRKCDMTVVFHDTKVMINKMETRQIHEFISQDYS